MFEKRLIFIFSCLAITILSKMYDTHINIIHKKKKIIKPNFWDVYIIL